MRPIEPKTAGDGSITRLVKVADVIKVLDEIGSHYEDGHDHLMRLAKAKVTALPPAEPEIICCEDCKYSDDKPIADGRYWCHINRSFMYYCSDAEKKC